MKPIIILMALSALSRLLLAQDMLQVQAGLGFPSLLHTGITCFDGPQGIGLTIGSLPAKASTLINVSTYYQYHFGKAHRLHPMPKWFIQVGMSYLADFNDKRVYTDVFLSPQMGYDVQLTRKMGLTIQAGLLVALMHHVRHIEPKQNNVYQLDLQFPILPAAQLAIYYRL